jgi:hypothetical protein
MDLQYSKVPGPPDFLVYSFRPYNARLTREAVAPIRPAWKGRTNGGSGATFAEETNLFDPHEQRA